MSKEPPLKKRFGAQPPGIPARAEPIDRLRDDVRLLGELVGEVLREQGGPSCSRRSSTSATAAIALRSHERATAQEAALLAWARRSPPRRLLQLVRAFSVYFHLINLAEQHHRVRTLRERAARRGPAARVDCRRGGGAARRRGATPPPCARCCDQPGSRTRCSPRTRRRRAAARCCTTSSRPPR